MSKLTRFLTLQPFKSKASTGHFFLDPFRSERRASVVLGMARSGTTKLAEMLCAGGHVRLLMEPLNNAHSPLAPSTFVWGAYVAPGARNNELRAVWSACLSGRVRDQWIDQFNWTRFARRRVVKCVAGMNLAPWLRHEFPSVGIVSLVRHPFAVATSLISLRRLEKDDGKQGVWDKQIGSVVDGLVERGGLLEGPLAGSADAIRAVWRTAQEPFDRAVLRWCLENVMTLTAPSPGVHVVFYERLFADPGPELAAIAKHLGLTLPPVTDQVNNPSLTDYRRKRGSDDDRSAKARISDWNKDLAPERRRAGLAILEMFGLDRFYSDESQPLRTVAQAQIDSLTFRSVTPT